MQKLFANPSPFRMLHLPAFSVHIQLQVLTDLPLFIGDRREPSTRTDVDNYSLWYFHFDVHIVISVAVAVRSRDTFSLQPNSRVG